MRGTSREQDDGVTIARHVTRAGGLSQNPLASVAIHGISQTFGRDEGNLTLVTFVARQHRYAHQRVSRSLPIGKDLLKFRSGFDGLHKKLDSEPLAALSATTGEDGTATLGRHAGTEAVALGALALVRLVGTLHFKPS